MRARRALSKTRPCRWLAPLTSWNPSVFDSQALKQLLVDLGIGASSEDDAGGEAGGEGDAGGGGGSGHRVLVFAQLRSVLDLAERLVLAPMARQGGVANGGGGVSWLRLDGNVPAAQRGPIVARFNRDPTIDVLLLTTQVTRASSLPRMICESK